MCGIVGYIGSFPIPEVIQGINSAYIHARKVNPDVEMRVVWAYSWFDPAKEADAANALMAEGVDVSPLMTHEVLLADALHGFELAAAHCIAMHGLVTWGIASSPA